MKPVMEKDWLTCKVLHDLTLPVHRARKILRARGEARIRALWVKLDTILEEWVKAQQLRRKLRHLYGLEHATVPKELLPRLPNSDDVDLVLWLLADNHRPLKRLVGSEGRPAVFALLVLHEAVCERRTGAFKAATFLEIACRNIVERQTQRNLAKGRPKGTLQLQQSAKKVHDEWRRIAYDMARRKPNWTKKDIAKYIYKQRSAFKRDRFGHPTKKKYSLTTIRRNI